LIQSIRLCAGSCTHLNVFLEFENEQSYSQFKSGLLVIVCVGAIGIAGLNAQTKITLADVAAMSDVHYDRVYAVLDTNKDGMA
jgi:hypothetical protein